jgi:DNA polymerase III alpha subunit
MPIPICGPYYADNHNEFISVRPSELNKLVSVKSTRLKSRMVAFHQVTFLKPAEYLLHMHLRAIDHNTLLTMITEEQLAAKNEIFQAPDKLYVLYKEYPLLLINATKIIEDCNFEFQFKLPRNKQIFSTSKYDDKILLESLAYKGMLYRYGPGNKVAEERIKKELQVIHDLGFCAYFLITWDIIQHTMSKSIHHVGRGSGGNSIVAYCLLLRIPWFG